MEAPCHAVIFRKRLFRNPGKNEKEKNGKVCEKREMYMKNNGTYFNLDKWIFVLQFTVICTVS
jgi:stalled ribosome alternative rescue factor ArfA